MHIITGDLADQRVIELLQVHLTTARDATGPCSAHALEHGSLRAPTIALWSIFEGESLLGVGALKLLSEQDGELKSMHTAAWARRRGAGGAMLRHIVAHARARGLVRLYAETGTWRYFEPAHALYRSQGFTECAPFGSYVYDPNSMFFTLDLAAVESLAA